MDRVALTKHIVTTAYKNKDGHIPSALSILDFLDVLYKRMKPEDEFILSKGHGSLALYAIMLSRGEITEEEFYSFGQFDSRLGGHPSSQKLPFVKVSTGSLGHGLPFAVGVAMAKKIKKEPGLVYCLIGDGEANEGSIWESVMIAQTQRLSNLVCIMDFNKSGERAVELAYPYRKFQAFGWLGDDVDGHNRFEMIERLLFVESGVDFPELNHLPHFIQLNTIKGKGIPVMEDNPAWHHRYPKTEEEYQELIGQIYA